MKFYDKYGTEHQTKISAMIANIKKPKKENNQDVSYYDTDYDYEDESEDEAEDESDDDGSDNGVHYRSFYWSVKIDFSANRVTITDGQETFDKEVIYEHNHSEMEGKSKTDIQNIIISSINKVFADDHHKITKYTCACGQTTIPADKYDPNKIQYCTICGMPANNPVEE